ncbi:MAG: cytochrome c3 family protein [Deltaproteobacteria bacterium]|nr:cytochrome c3 family protein [Deltaproteobacteria bacterium]
MKKQFPYLLVSVLVPLCILVAAGAQENMTTVDSSVFGKPERTQTVFRHESHNEKAKIDACNECHHVYKDGKKLEDASSEDKRCSDCHGLANSGRTPSLRKAFHFNCRGCHEKSGKGPVMCGECHLKENRR